MTTYASLSNALEGGEWVTIRGVRRYVTNAAAARWRASLIVCPLCKATLTQPCQAPSGVAVRDHKRRLVTRRCQCGGHVTPRATYCALCRHEIRKQSWAASKRRARAKTAKVAA